jgi:hypothetical protein
VGLRNSDVEPSGSATRELVQSVANARKLFILWNSAPT